MNVHRRARLAPCTSSVVLPLLPRWFERTAAVALASSALIAVACAAAGHL